MQEQITEAWKHIVNNEYSDKELIRQLKVEPQLNSSLKQFMDESNFDYDTLTLFNWFIGTHFGVSVNELNTTK